MTYSKTYHTTYAYDAVGLFADDLRRAGFEDQACELEKDLSSAICAPARLSDDTVFAVTGDLTYPSGYWEAEVHPTYTRVTLYTPDPRSPEAVSACKIRESYDMGCGIPEAPAHYLCKLAGREDDFMHTASEEALYDLLCEVSESLGVIIFDM